METDELYSLFLDHPMVVTDSRDTQSMRGALFFALKGAHFDGNRFAAEALSQGAAYAVIDDPDISRKEGMVLVDDVLVALQQLAAYHRKRMGVPVIAITGTNGKTTTKELLAAVLTQRYHLLYTVGNLNNHIGVPLTLLRLTKEHEFAVIEMGANHPGEIAALCEIALPDYGIVTNVGQAHLEGFGSLQGVLKSKGELYDSLRQRGGTVFVRYEDETLRARAHGLVQICYGTSSDAAVTGRVGQQTPCLLFQWQEQGGVWHEVTTHLVGGYNLMNLLAAIAVGCFFGVEGGQIDEALAAYRPVNNRSQWQETADNRLIIDAYNANPDSMKVALENFAMLQGSPKGVILGDMFELGDGARSLHQEVVQLLKQYAFEQVLLCGTHFSAVADDYRCFADVEALRSHLASSSLKGYHLLLKGSHGVHLERIIDLL